MTKRRMSAGMLALSLVSLEVFLGCGRTHDAATRLDSSSPAASPGSEDWLGFTHYPQARQLCDEFTMGLGSGNKPAEIHWVRFATRDAVQDAKAFYSKAPGGTVEVEGDTMNLHRGGPAEAV